ncbi:potassium ABC transporter ATPase [Paracoccus zeaxanthinifaciens]|uniref:potassium ABC transporter ATPase n=1 Tax=Paracoccus zeaxanthinifaciens TaxID=187400 RepID=UPI00048CCA74|nr:potassium ABC transporter ATPase [Paracoccus zeaxanthinifaciens]
MTISQGLAAALRAPQGLVIAVSGGMDSLCLTAAAARVRDGDLRMVHASSAAVPAQATDRVRRMAADLGLPLDVVDAREFADERYRANPVDRCYYCKTNLYRTLVAANPGHVVASGTNLDDLGDYRPGLRAAGEHGVIHPFADARMTKDDVRRLADGLGLPQIAALPASPCLASRIQTGLRVEPGELRMIDTVETRLREVLGPVTLRCRRQPQGIAIEIDETRLAALSDPDRQDIARLARIAVDEHGYAGLAIRLAPYRQGSAFIHA